jgi:long-subunit fatty acid transport protein
MKKLLKTLVFMLTVVPLLYAGGIVHNSNQSAKWVRTMVRDASVDVDAVFYNPAGLTRLEDGFYIQINTQTISQPRDVTSDFALLNSGDFEGTTFVPVLPTGFLAWKKGNLVLSAGFTVIGGGGGAEFEAGLPSFETPLAASLFSTGIPGVTEYDADITFSGSSAYFGYQVGVSYAINDMISVSVGGRYVTAKNSYTGHIKDIMFNPKGGDLVNANAFFTSSAEALQPAIDGTIILIDLGYGEVPIVSLQGTEPFIEVLKDLGYTQEEINAMDVNTVNAIFGGTQAEFYGGADQTADIEVDAVQKGSTFTPIVGIDLSFADDKVGLAVRYEHLSKMTVKNETEKDRAGAPLYPDGEESPAELPGNLSVGLRYNATDNLNIQTGMHYYFDSGAKFGRTDAEGNYITNGEEATFVGGIQSKLLESNTWEAAIGLEYGITPSIDVSGGFLYAKPNPNAVYQNDISNTEPTVTFGLGVGIGITSMIDLDLGFSFTTYEEFEKDVAYRDSSGNIFANPKEVYDKSTWILGLGLTAKL